MERTVTARGSVWGRLFDRALAFVLSPAQRQRLGFHILYRARGEGDDDAGANGEYHLLDTAIGLLSARRGKLCFFDVGANVGDWAIQASRGIPPGSMVYAFEPVARTFQELGERVSRADAGSMIRCVQSALGDMDGSVSIHLSGHLCGTNSLYVRRTGCPPSPDPREETVRVARGDTFCRETGIDHVDFMKIDVEGHEMAVLHGLEGMLSEGKIDMVQFEYGGTWLDSRRYLSEAFDFFLPKGYALGRIHPSGIEVFERYYQRQETFFYSNYLAVRNECLPALLREVECIRGNPSVTV